MDMARHDALVSKRAEALERHQLYQASYLRETFKELGGLLESAATLLRSASAQTARLLNDTTTAIEAIDIELGGTNAEHDVPEEDNAQTAAEPDPERLTDLVGSDGLDGSLIRRLLDFEAWTDTLCANGGDVEHVRFHTVHLRGNTILVLCCFAFFRDADRRKWPRKLIYSKPIRIAEDEDYEDELHEYVEWLLNDAIASVSKFLGADPEDYGRWLSTPPSEKGVQFDPNNEGFE